MAAFEFKNAEDVRAAFLRHSVRYLFFGKSGAILLGYSDTTQDVDLLVEKEPSNCAKIVSALLDLGFRLTANQQEEIRRGKDFVQLRNGPFDLDLVFAPDGIERFEDVPGSAAWKKMGSLWPASTTSYGANKQPTARATGNPFLASCVSESG